MNRTLRPFAANYKKNHGFTLVELLVVMAIIGILLGLLLPAVQAAREAARRCQCLNNIAQLGLAMHNHEFSTEHFPAGVTNPTGPIRNEAVGQHVSWVVPILPYLEQANVYSHFDQAAGTYAGANRDARVQRIPTLACPSFYLPSGSDDPDGRDIGITNYAGCHHDSEAPIDANNNGMLFLNSHIRFRDIRDGSSQTILLGEMLPTMDGFGWASGTRSTLRNTSFFGLTQEQLDGQTIPANIRDPLSVGGFGSHHTGGAQFVFADGSVRFLSESIDKALFRKLGNRADGELLYAGEHGFE